MVNSSYPAGTSISNGLSCDRFEVTILWWIGTLPSVIHTRALVMGLQPIFHCWEARPIIDLARRICNVDLFGPTSALDLCECVLGFALGRQH